MEKLLEQDLAELELALAAGPVAGPWELWTSCSWMRVKNAQGEEVLGPCKDVDGQLNLKARRGTLDYVVACHPERMSRVVSALKVLLAERACMKQQLVTLKAANAAGEASEAEVVLV
jgi:hypothetical protein